MTSSFVCATLNLGRKKSTGTEPKKYPFLIRIRAIFRTAAGTAILYVTYAASWTNGCQNFSYAHRSRKHWKCKYFPLKNEKNCTSIPIHVFIRCYKTALYGPLLLRLFHWIRRLKTRSVVMRPVSVSLTIVNFSLTMLYCRRTSGECKYYEIILFRTRTSRSDRKCSTCTRLFCLVLPVRFTLPV